MSTKDWMRLIGLSLLWGGSFFFVEVALEGLPPLTGVWGRVALGSGFLAIAIVATGGRFPKGRAVWLALIGMGFLNNVVPFTLFALAQGQITGAMAAILNATTPLWGLVLAHLLTADEKITAPKAVGLGLGFAGVVVMMGGMALGDLWASAACLTAAFFYGLATLWSRRFKRMGVAPLSIAWGQGHLFGPAAAAGLALGGSALGAGHAIPAGDRRGDGHCGAVDRLGLSDLFQAARLGGRDQSVAGDVPDRGIGHAVGGDFPGSNPAGPAYGGVWFDCSRIGGN